MALRLTPIDFTGKSIGGVGGALGTFTATAAGFVAFQIAVNSNGGGNGLAGGGTDYAVWLMHTPSGSNAYETPQRFETPRAANTYARWPIGPVDVGAGDTVAVYMQRKDGTGETIAGAIQPLDLAPLQPATAGRAIAVDSNGKVTPDTSFPTNFSALSISEAGVVAASGNWNVGKTGYTLTQAFPTNFSALSISEAGVVAASGNWNVGKTGYTLTQAFPTNFSALSISEAGVVTASGNWNVGKTGYELAATGLDAITIPPLTGPATTFLGKVDQVWRRLFKKATKTGTQIKTYADNGTSVLTTQTISDDGTTETQGPAT